MIARCSYIIEALGVIIALFGVYGKKKKADILTATLLAVDIIILECVNTFQLPKTVLSGIYIMLFFYCFLEFQVKVKQAVIGMLIVMMLIGFTQMFAFLLLSIVAFLHLSEDVNVLLINMITLFSAIVLAKKQIINRIYIWVNEKEATIRMAFLFCVLLFVCIFCIFKMQHGLGLLWGALFIIGTLVIYFLVLRLQKAVYMAKQKEMELKICDVYNEAYVDLLESVRRKQHSFQDHMATILSLHMTIDNYEDLVEAQKNYSKNIMDENKYYKILHDVKVPPIAGFLYFKLEGISQSKDKIDFSYQVQLEDVGDVLVYEFVEILGNLLNNAMEAVTNYEEQKQKIMLLCYDSETEVILEIKNVIDGDLVSKQFSDFFANGVSTKGEGRGLGLTRVKEICKKYKTEPIVKKEQIDGHFWISFQIVLPK